MPTSLLEVARELATDASAKAAFADDPDGFLTARGLEDLDARDVTTALEHVADALPPDAAAQLPEPDPTADDPVALFDGIAGIEPVDPVDLAFGEGVTDDPRDDGAEHDDEGPHEPDPDPDTALGDDGPVEEQGDDATEADPWSAMADDLDGLDDHDEGAGDGSLDVDEGDDAFGAGADDGGLDLDLEG